MTLRVPSTPTCNLQRDISVLMNLDSIERSKSGDADASCSCRNRAGSILDGAVITRVSFRSTVVGLQKDHAVTALHVDATPIPGACRTPLCWTPLGCAHGTLSYSQRTPSYLIQRFMCQNVPSEVLTDQLEEGSTMHLGRTARRGGAFALCAAGALTLGVGSASASTLTPAPQAAVVSSSQVYLADWDYCDDWNHRGDGQCRGDRWTWDGRNWIHDRWDGHRWNHRGDFWSSYCDDWNHRGDAHCRGDRWTWDGHRWNHDRWDGHQWNRR